MPNAGVFNFQFPNTTFGVSKPKTGVQTDKIDVLNAKISGVLSAQKSSILNAKKWRMKSQKWC